MNKTGVINNSRTVQKINLALCGYELPERHDFPDDFYITDDRWYKRDMVFRADERLIMNSKNIIIFLAALDQKKYQLFEYWARLVFAECIVMLNYNVLKRDNSYKNRANIIDHVFEDTYIREYNRFCERCQIVEQEDLDSIRYKWIEYWRPERNFDETLDDVEPTEELYQRYLKVLDYIKDSFARMSEENIHEFVEAMKKI